LYGLCGSFLSAIGKYFSGDLFDQGGAVLVVFKINFKLEKHFGPWVRPRARPSGHERNQINKKNKYNMYIKRHCSGEQAPALRNKKYNFYFLLFMLLTAKVYAKFAA